MNSQTRILAAGLVALFGLTACTNGKKLATSTSSSATAPSASASVTSSAGPAAQTSSSSDVTASSDSSSPATTGPVESSSAATGPSPEPTAKQTVAPPAATGPNAKFANDPAVTSLFAFIGAKDEAFRRRNARYLPLVALSTDYQQTQDAASIARMKANNWVLVGGTYMIVQSSRHIDADTAVIVWCEDDDSIYRADAKSGKPNIPIANRWNPFETHMRRQSGVWKVNGHYRSNVTCVGKLAP